MRAMEFTGKPKKNKKKVKEKTYQITPKGLCELSHMEGTNLWDALELYCYRYGYNGILINNEGGKFVRIDREPYNKGE